MYKVNNVSINLYTVCNTYACSILTVKLTGVGLIIFGFNGRTHENHIIEVVLEFNIVRRFDCLLNRKFNHFNVLATAHIQISDFRIMYFNYLNVWNFSNWKLKN